MIERATRAHFDSVAANMRERDRREIRALCWTDDILAEIRAVNLRFAWTAFDNGHYNPVCIFGVTIPRPNVASTFKFSTVHWPLVAIDVAKYARRVMIPAVWAAGVHRIQAFSMVESGQDSGWFRMFGATQEAVLKGYGKNGEDFMLFSLLRPVTSVGKWDNF